MIATRLTVRLNQTGRRAHSPRARRAGYTLLELTVVVALIVVIFAISMPSIVGMLSDAHLASSSDLIRGRLADARSMAVELGRPVRFGFIAGTGKFQIAPDDSDAWDNLSDTSMVEQDDLVRGELPEGILFATDMGSLSGGTRPSSGNSWEFGGVFLPEGGGRGAVNADGTTNDNVVFYFGLSGYSPMAVELRGLTASARVFDPLTEGDQR